jgi:hypothetical protein
MDPIAKRRVDEETIGKYEEIERQLLVELQQVRAVLSALGRPANHEPKLLQALNRVPTYDSIRDFLREDATPRLQSDIVREVGARRKALYPDIRKPYGDVWRSLVFRDRHDKQIVCVEWHGKQLRRGRLKQRPKPKRVPGGAEDCAELYAEPDNLFWFKDEIAGYGHK